MPKRPWQSESEATPWKPKSSKYGNTRYDADFYQSIQWRAFREYIKARIPMICNVCKGRAKYLDHIIPISQGGARLEESNIQWLCARCHTAKTNKERHQNNKN
jgi:5-methylcytosine-specific restriction enzyme A